jgi:4-amino-4-deoxy-L-arabinose transferase-like glycosyltransferase
VIVDVVPAGSRPYVGGSTDNSVRDLIFGYNGFERIAGDNSPFPGGRPPGGPGGFFGLNFGGAPGWARLFNEANAGQVAWLMPLALAGFLAAIAGRGLAPRTDPRRASVIYWGAWAAVHFVVFSKAKGIFHPYYTAALAPGLAALVGIAAATVVAWARRPGVWLWTAPAIALAATAALQIYLLRREPPWNEWLEPAVIVAMATALTFVMLGAILVASGVRRANTLAAAGVLVGFVALFLSPLTWSVSVVDARLTGEEPQAGPHAQVEGIPFDLPADQAIAVFLTEEQGNTRFLMATFGASGAAPYIVETGEPVLAIGGFVGTDPVPTLDDFKELIVAGKLRFVMLGGLGLLFQPELQAFVRQSCVEVAHDRYADSQKQPPGGVPNVFAGPLYDCSP